jgi:hypothetical protein
VSEYQCYEFVALDRPLIAKEMAELRGISTRAEITPTRFWNEYHWGDLKADPAKLLARYFDLHLYFANWGTRRLMLRLPIAAVDNRALGAYLPGDPATLTTVGEHAIVDLCSEVDEPEDDWFEAGGLAGSLTPLRAELLRGDLRVAYLAWLLAVQAGAVGPRAVEPPVPSGLGGLSAPLAALAEFLRVDRDLLAVAAQASAQEDGIEAGRFRAWVKDLPARERERWLLRAADHPELALGSELLGAFRRAHPPVPGGRRRTVAQLLAGAETVEDARRRAAAERAAQARAAAAAERERQLEALARREPGRGRSWSCWWRGGPTTRRCGWRWTCGRLRRARSGRRSSTVGWRRSSSGTPGDAASWTVCGVPKPPLSSLWTEGRGAVAMSHNVPWTSLGPRDAGAVSGC